MNEPVGGASALRPERAHAPCSASRPSRPLVRAPKSRAAGRTPARALPAFERGRAPEGVRRALDQSVRGHPALPVFTYEEIMEGGKPNRPLRPAWRGRGTGNRKAARRHRQRGSASRATPVREAAARDGRAAPTTVPRQAPASNGPVPSPWSRGHASVQRLLEALRRLDRTFIKDH